MAPNRPQTLIGPNVRVGSKAEKLRLSKCLLLFPKQRTFIKATAANSTRIDAARNKPPHPELIDKFADWLIALSSGGLFVLMQVVLGLFDPFSAFVVVYAARSGSDVLKFPVNQYERLFRHLEGI